ncbi:MAG: hypothetical protein RLZZ15_3058 [Verrucomicrobiota bacterium]|jgi:hypothetical protein
MGLTIHYTQWLRRTVSPERALERVQSAHRQAAQMVKRRKLRGITPILPAADEPWAVQHKCIGTWPRGDVIQLVPSAGWVFTVDVGRGCEPAMFGLCRYPASVRKTKGLVPTGCGSGWRLQKFSKTQYASLHGPAHFLKCHRAVIDLALIWERLGCEVTIDDEGDYWPTRDRAALFRHCDFLNAAIAGAAGALKDLAEEKGGPPVRAPIFAHPRFERLEAEGAIRHGEKIAAFTRVVAGSP